MRRRFSFKNDNEHSLIITANSSSTVLFQINAFGDCEYNLNNTGWKIYSQTPFSINAGETIRFRGQLSYSSTAIGRENGIGRFIITGDVDLSGSPMYMLSSNKLAYNIFCKLFYNCTGIKNVSADFLPATTLAEYCYGQMFYGCTSLTTAPQLPATTLESQCYEAMFDGCTSLSTAPALPVTTLASYCYRYMFHGCTSLTTAPALPATTLASGCYRGMFQGCTSLTTAPQLPATTLEDSCYNSMFSGCSSLTAAPELPATTLATQCYLKMFYNCSKLNYIKAMFTTTPSTYIGSWVYGVASSGTFVKNKNATWDVTATSDNNYIGIPLGWTVQTA